MGGHDDTRAAYAQLCALEAERQNYMKLIAVALLISAGVIAQTKPMVLIRGDGSTTVSAVAVGPVASASASKHDQTIEMADQLRRHCPDVTLTVSATDQKADYILALNAVSGGFLIQSTFAQVILLRGSDKTVLWTGKGGISKAMKESCKAILSDWQVRTTAASK
jgi:hypothetical protein